MFADGSVSHAVLYKTGPEGSVMISVSKVGFSILKFIKGYILAVLHILEHIGSTGKVGIVFAF
jgi:hypothetical protein